MKKGLFALILIFAGGAQALDPRAVTELSCPGFTPTETEFKLSRLNGKALTYEGVRLPGTNQVLFRGIYEANPQYDAVKALRGILEEKHWYLGSPIFEGLSGVLTNKKSLHEPYAAKRRLNLKMSELFAARRIEADVRALLKCQPQGYSSELADVLAADLMNKAFFRVGASKIEDRYFNLKNPDYYTERTQSLGFGNNAADFVISSTYDQVAALYGNKILVLKDTRQRSLDLSLWNLHHTGVLYDTWVDAGEVNAPGYITSGEVLGYQSRKLDRQRGDGWGASLLKNPIDSGIYKIKYQNKTFALVLDGASRLCLLEGADGRFYFCQKNWDGLTERITPYPRISSTAFTNRVALMGVFALCSEGEACQVPEELWDWYGKTTSRALPQALLEKTRDLVINGQKVSYIAAPPRGPGFEGIQVLSATYLAPQKRSALNDGNVTAVVSEYLNGKTKANYKVTSEHLKLPHEKTAKEFELSWICAGSPEKTRTHKIKAPASGKTFVVTCEDEATKPGTP